MHEVEGRTCIFFFFKNLLFVRENVHACKREHQHEWGEGQREFLVDFELSSKPDMVLDLRTLRSLSEQMEVKSRTLNPLSHPEGQDIFQDKNPRQPKYIYYIKNY